MELEGRSRISDELSIAPLIDVVFLLLLFFMLTSTFVRPEAIDLALPTSDTALARDDEAIEVAVNAEGAVFLNEEAIALDALPAAIEAALGDDLEQTISFKSDAELRVQAMLDVVDGVREGGGRNLAFVTQRRSGDAASDR